MPNLGGATTPSHRDVEHLILSLAGIPGGRPLFQMLLESMQNLSSTNTEESEPVDNPPPPPSDGSTDPTIRDDP
ncbi:hypothetical protein PC114_g8369 [Phytophthora cactorum]|nr:hypothetical protein PC114_g8369 [Phytophthora cactorum]